jgi:hypothetical protein
MRQQSSGVKVLAVCALLFACIKAVSSFTVSPATGDDLQCGSNALISCKTIARAVALHFNVASLNLSAGVYNEPTINISNFASLVINGVPNATVFDCSQRRGSSDGAVFSIMNSTVIITGVTFQNCSNPSSNGGAVSAIGSSLVLSHCSFTTCSAASGGAISVTGHRTAVFLSIQNSTFARNRAVGGLAGCPSDVSLPCSTWGGAIAVFEMFNVTVSGCTMTDNNARAFVPPPSSELSRSSSNAVAGGGCLSVLFRGNTSGSAIRISGNTFVGCTVDVSAAVNSIMIGNGVCKLRKRENELCILRIGLLHSRIRWSSVCLLWPVVRTVIAAAGRERVVCRRAAPE